MIKVVKAITIVLGIFICIALGMLGYGFYSTSGEPQNQPSENMLPQTGAVSNIPKPSVGAMGVDIGGIAMGQPKGSTIVAVQPQGPLVYVTVQGGGVADRIVIVDLYKRRVVGEVVVGTLSSLSGAPLVEAPNVPVETKPGAIPLVK